MACLLFNVIFLNDRNKLPVWLLRVPIAQIFIYVFKKLKFTEIFMKIQEPRRNSLKTWYFGNFLEWCVVSPWGFKNGGGCCFFLHRAVFFQPPPVTPLSHRAPPAITNQNNVSANIPTVNTLHYSYLKSTEPSNRSPQ